jgi:hypothetical protein
VSERNLRSRDLGRPAPPTLTYAEVEAWLRGRRDRCSPQYDRWDGLNDALDDLRKHMATGTALGRPVRRHDNDEETA